jgi:hypothetical protein
MRNHLQPGISVMGARQREPDPFADSGLEACKGLLAALPPSLALCGAVALALAVLHG